MASRRADRAAARRNAEWLDAAASRGASVAHRIASGATAVAVLGEHDEPLVVLSRL